MRTIVFNSFNSYKKNNSIKITEDYITKDF